MMPRRRTPIRREHQSDPSIRLSPAPILIPHFSLAIHRASPFEPVRDAHNPLSPFPIDGRLGPSWNSPYTSRPIHRAATTRSQSPCPPSAGLGQFSRSRHLVIMTVAYSLPIGLYRRHQPDLSSGINCLRVSRLVIRVALQSANR